MNSTEPLPIVGVYHDNPDPFLPILRDVLPERQLRICTRWDGLPGIIGDVDVLLAFKFGNRPFPRQVILEAPRLKWVQLASAGVDHITPFDPERLVVTNASGIHGDTMAEFVIATLLRWTWDFPRLVRQHRDRTWERYFVPGLAGRTMGVLGLGHVGTTIGRRAAAFGMRVHGTRRSGRPVEGIERVYGPDRTDTVLAESDVVVISLPLTAMTRGGIGTAQLRCLKPTAYLINVSRGGIVDEPALIDLLEQGAIAGAVLDVFQQEPLPPDSRFWSLPNTLVTPHISSEFERWPDAVARKFVRNLTRWIRREPLEKVVDPVAGY